jgi:CheY-like chemotaxis protein
MKHTSVEVTVEAVDRRRRVLFVNADADLREVVSRVLEDEGYDVRAVAHSGHAVLLGRTNQFDVIVAELSGPDVSGPVLAAQLRRHCPTLTAVYVANPGTPEGMSHIVVRPFTREDLLEGIESALSGIAA